MHPAGRNYIRHGGEPPQHPRKLFQVPHSKMTVKWAVPDARSVVVVSSSMLSCSTAMHVREVAHEAAAVISGDDESARSA